MLMPDRATSRCEVSAGRGSESVVQYQKRDCTARPSSARCNHQMCVCSAVAVAGEKLRRARCCGSRTNALLDSWALVRHPIPPFHYRDLLAFQVPSVSSSVRPASQPILTPLLTPYLAVRAVSARRRRECDALDTPRPHRAPLVTGTALP